MIFQVHIPNQPLSLFVDYMWYSDGCNPPGARELNLPEGSVDLLIDLEENHVRMQDRSSLSVKLGASVVCGPQSDYFLMDSEGRRVRMGVHFRPGGAAAFLGVPVWEAYNSHVGLDDLWGAGADALRDELLYASTVQKRFSILERHLSARCDGSRSSNPAIAYALKQYMNPPSIQSVGDTTRELNLSPKRFIELFREEVGMTPKRFCRLIRFQLALRMIRQCREPDWADIALSCGYYDQAHFNKEFQALSGLTPTEYREKRGVHPSHVMLFR